MQIAILNGEPLPGSPFDQYVADLRAALAAAGHDVTDVCLRDLEISGCKGCWGCWVNTPGECVHHDDRAIVARAVMGSDLTLLASPMHMGFVSSLLKRAADTLIPLVHPYVVLEGGEMHHRARYARYPLLGLLLGPRPDTDAEDIDITRAMWTRTARNLKSHLALTAITSEPVQEVAHAIAAAH